MMTKTGMLLKLMGLLIEKNEIANSTTWVQTALGDCSPRTLDRYLREIQAYYPKQIETRIANRITFYKLRKTSDILLDFLGKIEDVTWVIELINESDKELFSELELDTKRRLDTIMGDKKDLFLYHNSPFEELKNDTTKQVFETLKTAIKERKYQNIEYHYNNYHKFEEVQCLRLIFMENNWYVAVATAEKKVFFLRIPFIQKIRNSSNHATFQLNQIERYVPFFQSFQNPMTLFSVEVTKAHILASEKVAKYFKPEMKKLMVSQEFLKENSDGTVEFTIDFTQDLEILPFVKKWLPDLKILSPKSLEDSLISDLKNYLK